MRTVQGMMIAAALVALPAIAAAQSQTPPPPATPAPTTVQPATTSSSSSGTDHYSTESYWTAAGFVGSNFGARADSASVNFGGQLAYLYKGAIGGEFLADFAPNFRLNNALLADNPMVNSYMLNVIGAVPLGSEAHVQPYVSGGFGGIQLRSDMLTFSSVPGGVTTTTSANQTRFGGNIGAGLAAFAGNVGIRGDVRYFRAFTNNDIATTATTPADVFAQNLLSGLDFWRANIGVAVRW